MDRCCGTCNKTSKVNAGFIRVVELAVEMNPDVLYEVFGFLNFMIVRALLPGDYRTVERKAII